MDTLNDRGAHHLSLNRALQKLLKSEEFASSENSQKLLRYLIEASMDGRAGTINPQMIGVEVFGRVHGYDAVADPIVAEELGSLKARLKHYRLTHPDEDLKLDFSDEFWGPSPQRRERRVKRAQRPLLTKRELFAAIVFLGLGLAILWSYATRGDADAAINARFTPIPGQITGLSLLPDKTTVLVAAQAGPRQAISIQTIPLAASPLAQPTPSRQAIWFPSYSPNSGFMAFLQQNEDENFDLMLKNLDSQKQSVLAQAVVPTGVVWSPDSASVYFSQSAQRGLAAAIMRLDLGSGSKRQVSKPGLATYRDTDPVLSPDGKRLAFRRQAHTGEEIWAANLDGPAAERAESNFTHFGGHAWSADGKTLFAAMRKFGRDGIWRIGLDRGQTELVSTDLVSPAFPVLAGDNKILLADQNTRDSMVEWKIADAQPRSRLVQPPPDTFTVTSPDGKRIAWIQNTASGTNLVLSNFDSRPPRFIPLSDPAGPESLAWFPDGSAIVVASLRRNHSVLQAISLQDGLARSLTDEDTDAWYPAFAEKGNRFCYTSTRSGGMEIWCSTWPETQSGAARQITNGGAVLAVLAPAGESIYFMRPNSAGLYQQGVSDGLPKLVLAGVAAEMWGAIAANENSLFVGCSQYRMPSCTVVAYDADTLRQRSTLNLGNATLRAGRSLVLNPESKSVSFVAIENRSAKLRLLRVDQ